MGVRIIGADRFPDRAGDVAQDFPLLPDQFPGGGPRAGVDLPGCTPAARQGLIGCSRAGLRLEERRLLPGRHVDRREAEKPPGKPSQPHDAPPCPVYRGGPGREDVKGRDPGGRGAAAVHGAGRKSSMEPVTFRRGGHQTIVARENRARRGDGREQQWKRNGRRRLRRSAS